jgi:hypothetical protein
MKPDKNPQQKIVKLRKTSVDSLVDTLVGKSERNEITTDKEEIHWECSEHSSRLQLIGMLDYLKMLLYEE